MASSYGNETATETMSPSNSPATAIQCASKINFFSTDWTVYSAFNESKQQPDVCRNACFLDAIDVNTVVPADRKGRTPADREPAKPELLSTSESPAVSSPASSMADIYTPFSSTCSSPAPKVIHLKSILKNPLNPRNPHGFEKMAFGFQDADEYDADSDMDEDDDDMSEDDGSDIDDYNGLDDYGDEYSDDEGSFICFVNTVHFSDKDEIRIIPGRHENGDSHAEPEMTFHEQAQRIKGSKHALFEPYSVNKKEYDSSEHGPDLVDIDKQLFVAYVNGIRNMGADDYQPVVLSRTLNADPCDVEVIPIIEYQVNSYLDRVLESLLGFFPHLFGTDEYNRILDNAEAVTSFDDYNGVIYEPSSSLFQRAITDQLATKLADGPIAHEDHLILDWAAGELIEPLGRQALFRWG
ncbi:hypothetical protein AJ79_02470 [Helicocarpus griseus UAMH5409]|uniref:Uncharacterized protein n=1 Tax=Helicocarpus griseus UAMH5409 TaxID=1447875 RepID=A0A2B7Y283_9EURO|nr:hypothetical protein AJ79_02470 [Helicocarpus griseus UAMH5409]